MTQLLPYTPPASGGLRPPKNPGFTVSISHTTLKCLPTALGTVIYTDTQTCKMKAELSKSTFQTQNQHRLGRKRNVKGDMVCIEKDCFQMQFSVPSFLHCSDFSATHSQQCIPLAHMVSCPTSFAVKAFLASFCQFLSHTVQAKLTIKQLLKFYYSEYTATTLELFG